MTRWVAGLLLALLAPPALADMYQDASNAQLPAALSNLGAMSVDAGNAPLPAAQNNLGIVRTIQAYGGKGDGQSTATITTTAGSATFGGLSLTAADVGKLISVPGAGTGGAPHTTTIATPTTFAAAATSAVSSSQSYGAGACVPVAPGAGYAPNDVITVSGGTGTIPTQCTVLYTKVVSLTATGTSAGNGPCTFTGSTGLPALGRFSATGTVTAGVLTGPFVVTASGAYTTNPTNPAAEPITATAGCGGLTGTAVLSVGVFYAKRTQNGLYTVPPANPAATTSSGSGTGATFNMTYRQGGAASWGTDNHPAIVAAMASTDSPTIRFPAGTYLTSSCARIDALSSVELVGDAATSSTLRLPPECTFPGGGYLAWVGRPYGRVRDLGIDVNYGVRTGITGQLASPIFFNGTAGQVVDTRIVNAGPRFALIAFTGGNTFVLNNILVQNNYTHFAETSLLAEVAVLFSQSTGRIVNPRVLNNVMVGSGISGDGIGMHIEGNDISNFSTGTGIFVASRPTDPVPSNNPVIVNNSVHDSAPGFDINTAAPGGVENDAPGALIANNKFFNLGGAGVVNFGTDARGYGNDCVNTGLGLGLQSAFDYKVNACWRNARSGTFPNPSAILVGNTSNATGGQLYGFIEDSSLGPPSVLRGNSFAGITKSYDIKVAGTAVDRISSLTVAGLPVCNAGTIHQLIAVSDQLAAPTYRGALTGGGAIPVIAYCNGATWEAH